MAVTDKQEPSSGGRLLMLYLRALCEITGSISIAIGIAPAVSGEGTTPIAAYGTTGGHQICNRFLGWGRSLGWDNSCSRLNGRCWSRGGYLKASCLVGCIRLLGSLYHLHHLSLNRLISREVASFYRACLHQALERLG